MSGGWTRTYAMYVLAGLCPNGCGDTLQEEMTADGPRTFCDFEEGCWFGPSRQRAEEILTPSPLPATREEQ